VTGVVGNDYDRTAFPAMWKRRRSTSARIPLGRPS